METLSMCRICVSDDIPLRSIVNTHLQEMYEILTKMPFVTEGNRPLVACDPCRASLENCYELRRRCLSSEERFAQLLRSNVQVDRQMGDMLQKIPIEYVKVEMKTEVAEEERGENRSFTHSEDVPPTCSFIKVEIDIDNPMPDDEAVDEEDTDLYNKYNAQNSHTEYDIPLDIVKEAPDDVDTDAPVSKESHLTKDNIKEPKIGTKRAVKYKPVKKNKIVETRAEVDVRLHNSKQNDSTSDYNDAHKEMSENRISADQSVNKSSSKKRKPLLCDICQKCFRHECHFIVHMRTHTGEKPFECNVCKKCFTNKCGLDNHIRTHTGEKPYQCDVCQKCFNRKNNLDIHMRTHTGEKPFECNICQKSFKHKVSLDIHVRTHTGEKHPFQCNICMKYFSKKWYLNVHTRTHTGDKPYECSVCKKSFHQKKTLGNHIRLKHS